MQLSGNNQIPVRYITKPATGKIANPTIIHLAFILNPIICKMYVCVTAYMCVRLIQIAYISKEFHG